MEKMKKYLTITLVITFILALTGCDLIERNADSVDKTVYAKVGRTKITKGEVDQALKQYLDYYKSNYGEDYESNSEIKETLKSLRIQQLDGLVDKEVLYQNAKNLGVQPTEDEINAEVDNRIAYYKDVVGSDEKYTAWLEGIGYNEESFKENLKNMIIVSMVVDKILEDVEVSDEEVEKYYNDNIDNYTNKQEDVVTPLDDKLKVEIRNQLLYSKQEEIYKTKLDELKKNIKIKKYEDRI